MRILLHDNRQQSRDCLRSLVDLSNQIAATSKARSFRSLEEAAIWIRSQPIKLDRGETPQLKGCYPTQRGRVWPVDGLNCWEATAHYLGVASALGDNRVFHVHDVPTSDGGRHVYPSVQDILQLGDPVPVVLQDAGSTRAQAGGNVVADIGHGVGGGILNLFGMGDTTKTLEGLWAMAPEEYTLSKNLAPNQGEKKPDSAPPALPLLSPEENELLKDPKIVGLLQKLLAKGKQQ